MEEELQAARESTMTGDSVFAQMLVPTIIANCAPLIGLAIDGAEGRRQRNMAALELAGAYLAASNSNPEYLFTPHGIRAIRDGGGAMLYSRSSSGLPAQVSQRAAAQRRRHPANGPRPRAGGAARRRRAAWRRA